MPLLFALLTCICYFSPGVLLHVWLRERGLALATCIGLGLGGLIVLDVWLAVFFGYRFPLQLAVNVIAVGALGWRLRREIPGWIAWARSQWPWPVLGWGAVAALFIVPALVVTLPFDTDAQGFGLLALTTRLSGSINSMAPFWPEIKYFYSPGFFLLAAQLSDMAGGATMPPVILGLAHTLAAATVAGVAAVGREFGGERVGGWTAAFSVLSYGLFSTLMDAAYTTVLGTLLITAIIVLVFRATREPTRLNVALAAVTLASLPLSHPDSLIHLLMAYLPFYFTIWLSRERPTLKQYAALTAIIPALGIALYLPWLIKMLPLLAQVSVHERQNPTVFLLFNILFVFPYIALAGLALALWRRRWFDVWLIGWAIMILEIAGFGNLDTISRATEVDPMQVLYPFGVAWHAPIVPVPILAAMAVTAVPLLGQWTPPPSWRVAVASLVIVGAAVAGIFHEPIIRASKGRVSIVGSFNSKADIRALHWLRDNTPKESFILNYVSIEGDWVPVIAERKTVQFREQLFYIGQGPAWALQPILNQAYLDPASPESEAAMRSAGIDYVFVPQVIGRPESFAEAMRWRPPFIEPQVSSFAEAVYLELIQDFDGAQIWKVKR